MGVKLKNFIVFVFIVFVFIFSSCSKSVVESSLLDDEGDLVLVDFYPGARPLAVLQTGRYPLWFQLTDDGPVHIAVIEDAVYTSALVPWPYALHIQFLHEGQNELVMTVNRGGFLKIAPNTGDVPGLALYRFSGGDFWKQYTVGGFVYFEGNPAALLYLDNRFMNTGAPLPNPRAWTFNMESNVPFPLEIPALEFFPTADFWEVDTLRLGNDGLYYYRVARRTGSSPAIRMFRTDDLTKSGEEISSGVFYDSFTFDDIFTHSALPPLPEGFVYTATGEIEGNLFAAWEEQSDFNIGAAGFVILQADF